MRLIELVQKPKLAFASLGRDSLRRLQVEHRRRPRPKRRSLIDRRQPAVRPVANSVDRQTARVRQDHVSRQILVLAPERIHDPRAPGRPAGQDLARMNQPQRRLVIDRFGRHRPHQSQIIRDPGDVRNQLAQHHSRIAHAAGIETEKPAACPPACRSGSRASPDKACRDAAVSTGLGSNRSIWLGPPCWNRQITDRARALRPGTPVRDSQHPSQFAREAPTCTRILLVEQVGQRQCPKRAGISAQKGTAIQSEKVNDPLCASWSSSSRFNQSIEEGIAGKEHLAEIRPGVMVRVGLGGTRVAGSCCASRNRLAALSSSGSGARLMQSRKPS